MQWFVRSYVAWVCRPAAFGENKASYAMWRAPVVSHWQWRVLAPFMLLLRFYHWRRFFVEVLFGGSLQAGIRGWVCCCYISALFGAPKNLFMGMQGRAVWGDDYSYTLFELVPVPSPGAIYSEYTSLHRADSTRLPSGGKMAGGAWRRTSCRSTNWFGWDGC